MMKKTLLYGLLLLTLFSCYKLEENDKRYTARKLQKMLEGTWEMQDYQIDGVSYLDTFLKKNIGGNCQNYTFTQWKNSKYSKSSDDYETGDLCGDCGGCGSSRGYSFYPKKKQISIGYSYFIDSIFFFDNNRGFNVLKLEKNELVFSDETNQHHRRISFIKK